MLFIRDRASRAGWFVKCWLRVGYYFRLLWQEMVGARVSRIWDEGCPASGMGMEREWDGGGPVNGMDCLFKVGKGSLFRDQGPGLASSVEKAEERCWSEASGGEGVYAALWAWEGFLIPSEQCGLKLLYMRTAWSMASLALARAAAISPSSLRGPIRGWLARILRASCRTRSRSRWRRCRALSPLW